jgi:hypothetical protein
MSVHSKKGKQNLSAEIYYTPNVTEHEEFINYVKELPLTTSPSIFGLNENADILKDQQETQLMLTNILITQVIQIWILFLSEKQYMRTITRAVSCQNRMKKNY